jgi:hypothetical protein
MDTNFINQFVLQIVLIIRGFTITNVLHNVTNLKIILLIFVMICVLFLKLRRTIFVSTSVRFKHMYLEIEYVLHVMKNANIYLKEIYSLLQ